MAVRLLLCVFLFTFTATQLTCVQCQADKDDICDVNINNPRTDAFKKNLAAQAISDADPEYWRSQARATLNQAKILAENLDSTAKAKNIILFIGDGMNVQTVVGARILKGQKNDMPGEEGFLSFEQFPYVGMSKTYNVDSQVADCASSATAILSGVKTRNRMVGLSGRATPGDCASAAGNEVKSILETAKTAGWNVGIVTTAALVNSTPAAAYAHTPDEKWRCEVPADQSPCQDIAKQFVNSNFKIDVALGGGRWFFMRNDQADPEDPTGTTKGGRTDGLDLIQSWKTKYGAGARYVTNKDDLVALDASTDYVLGMFNQFDMDFDDSRSSKEPSLTQMVEKAIQLLQDKGKQYFLLVEGANIDRGHHENRVGKALHETLAMDQAVERAVALTGSADDTLVIVTADHGTPMSMAGYPCRGHPILGKVYARGDSATVSDKRPYTQMAYYNGPSAEAVQAQMRKKEGRPTLDDVDTEDMEYQAQSLVPFPEGTHGGEDVQIFAKGPMSHLVQGVHEQSYINTVMLYSACLGRYSGRTGCYGCC